MLLVDTSALLANYDRQEEHHIAVRDVLARGRRLILSPFVLAELDYMLAQVGGEPAELPMLRDVAEGRYELAQFDAGDVGSALRLIERYNRLNIGLTDASIVVLTERYQCLNLLTLDQRHFRAITGPGGQPFRILPFDA